MHTLIKIQPTAIGGTTVQTVNARELHAFLQSGQEFRHWIKARIEQYDFVENQDFTTSENFIRGGKATDYHLTIDMAKEISMVERNQKGKDARQYFIECERRAKAVTLAPASLSRLQLIEMAMQAEEERLLLEAQVAEQAPKVAFHDDVAVAENAQSIATIAKVLGTGERRLFAWLRNERLLMSNNLPYQAYVDRGYFKVIEKRYTDTDGEMRIYAQTQITGKGLIAIQKKFVGARQLALTH